MSEYQYPYTILNRVKDRDLGIVCIGNPNIPFAEKEINFKSIDGREEELTIDTGKYKNIEITITYAYIDRENWHHTARKIKTHLDKMRGGGTLQLHDDYYFYYKVKDVKLSSIERFKSNANLVITFICSPFIWSIEGDNKIDIKNGAELVNNYILAKPKYILNGNGQIQLTVNNNPTIINLVDNANVIIDTDKQRCYREDKITNLLIRQGEYEDLWLNPTTDDSKNSIKINVLSGNLNSAYIIPKYRSV